MLTDTKIRNAKPRGTADTPKGYKLPDEKALYLWVSPTGAKSFRYDYRFAGKRPTLTYGLYPAITLSAARQMHQDARRLLASGVDPGAKKKRDRQTAAKAAANTFKAVAEEWRAKLAPFKSDSWRDGTRRWLDKRIYPVIGSMPIAEVSPADVAQVVEAVAQDHPQTAEYIRQTISRICRHAVAKRLCTYDPAHLIRGSVVVPPPVHHGPMKGTSMPAFLKKVRAYSGRRATVIAAELLLLTCVRKTELTKARVSELDWEAAQWRIPAHRMKCRRDHIVPLSTQAAELFREAVSLNCGSDYVFPNLGSLSLPMSHSTLNRMLVTCGNIKPHSMRSTFATEANESNKFRDDVIERSLAHVDRNKVRGTYNAAKYLPERAELMQWWADFCTRPANVASLNDARRARKAEAQSA